MSSQIPGTNVPPISFPGIASGIDYNSIIQKLTSLSLSQNVSLNQQVATLNAANTELIKINGLLQGVQSALASLSSPNLFNSFSTLSSNLSAATAQSIATASQPAVPGTYTITKTTLATASSVTGSATAGHSIKDVITSGPYTGSASDTVPLAKSYAAVTPSNGTGTSGTITVDGITVSYNVNVDSLQAILNRIQTAVQTKDATFTASVNASGVVSFQSGAKPISVGAATDQGNLLQVLKISNAQVVNTPTSGVVTGTSDVGGISQTAALNGTNAANFKTAVTSGFFTINGVAITVDATGDNVASILAKINASTAGVSATYSSDTNQISLTSKATGPQSIVVGAAGDTSNFLTATGLTAAAGATSTTGTQASVTVQSASGSTQTYYSNSNQVTNAIQGVQLNLLSATATPFTVSVGQDSTQLVSAVNSFVSAYNSAVSEINTASAPPLITGNQPGSSLPGAPATPIGGGILWGVADVSSIKDRLANIVSGFFGSDPKYNSLASLGLQLTSTFSVLTTSNNGATNGGTAAAGTSAGAPVQNTTYQGTDGQLSPLDSTKFAAAFQANPNAVQQVLQGAQGLSNQLGTYLTGLTGAPTLLFNGPVGTIPTTSIIQGFENADNSNISSLQDQIKRITDAANMQADSLRQQFTATEGTLAVYQSLQSSLSGFFKQG